MPLGSGIREGGFYLDLCCGVLFVRLAVGLKHEEFGSVSFSIIAIYNEVLGLSLPLS
jgi:hypothetical protein